ncbi:uncharacterized protein [Littorina saxatilis]|uniref:snRNA-activating protein complex subunit 4 n=1 Tax=Littorina saxatilis TaxID=31220 RepID=A0AAN9AXP4_9CAEN
MEDEREELQADIEKLQHTLEEDSSLWQYDIVGSDDDIDSDDDDALFIDLEKHGSATASVASLSLRSAGGRTTPSGQSIGSHPTNETQSVTTDADDDTELFREVGVVLEKLDSSSLPATLESCLVINRTYQEIVREHIGRIELELADNREAQRRVEEEAKDSHLQQNTRKRFPYNTSIPYFKIRFGSTPASNEDVKLKILAQEPDLDKRPDAPWYQRHKKILIKVVTEDALEKLLQPLLSRREIEEEKLEQTAENGEEWHLIKARIANIDEEIEQKRKTPQDQLLANVDTNRVDWMKISNITFHGRRDWQVCQRAWLHSVSPRINHDEWKPEEEQRLSELIKETNGSNWVYIAQQLGTGRTAFQCLQYYQQHLNPEMLSRPWSKEEDKQLISVVEKCRQVHFNWTKVSSFMEGRSGLQCYKRFTKLDPDINKGYWTEAEDGQLMAAVHLVGSTSWGIVSELVPGRTREQCRERYVNSLDPKISGKAWTYEEDKKLLQLAKQHGVGSWVKMCKDLPGRTDNQVLQRYRRLEDWQRKADWFKKQSNKDKDLLQGNNLSEEKKEKTQKKNWEEFGTVFSVFREDYNKQNEDIAKGEEPVPRPPLMLGLASKSGGKTWERRIKLHKLIESHINNLRERYNFTTIGGMYELQDAVSQLSHDCIAQRDELLNNRSDRLAKMIHKLPSQLHVRDLLAVTRGGKVHKPKRRGPLRKKKRGSRQMPPRLSKSMKLDSELRQVVRANLKDRSLKKGRPRRFFWDINGEQKLSNEDRDRLKANTLNLYMKSLGADPGELLKEGRKAFPDLFHKLQEKHRPAPPPEEDIHQPGCSADGRPLRRSRRVRKIKDEDEPQNTDPFSIDDQPRDTIDFSTWQKLKDYELLEWLTRLQGIRVDFNPEGPLSTDDEIPTAGTVEVSTNQGGERAVDSGAEKAVSEAGDAESDLPVIGHGMSLVDASIQQAMEESEAGRTETVPSSSNVNSENSVRNEKSSNPTGNGKDESSTNNDRNEDSRQQVTAGASGDANSMEVSCDNATVIPGPSISGDSNCNGKNGVNSGENEESRQKVTAGWSGDADNSMEVGNHNATVIPAPPTRADSHEPVVHSSESVSTGVQESHQPHNATLPSQSQVQEPSSSTSQDSNPTPPGTSGNHNATPPRAVTESQFHRQSSNTSQGTNTIPRGPSSNQRQLPELPPTASSMQSFKTLLLRRLGLIKKAGGFYNLQYYLQQKDQQLASLIRAGNTVQDINRGTIDLGRMMNRISQETDFNKRKQWTKKDSDKAKATQAQLQSGEDSKNIDHEVLNALRQTEDYKLLESRFQALFTWPALMSTIYPPFQRKDYSQKAGPGSQPRPKDPYSPHFNTARNHLPLLKPKGFYKYAMKSRQEKEAILLERKKKKVIQEVKKLMADEDDPDPQVTLELDSDDDNTQDSNDPTITSIFTTRASSKHQPASSEPSTSQEPTPSTSQTSTSSTAADKKRKVGRPPVKRSHKQVSGPLRKSSRHVERKKYEVRINKPPKPRQKPLPSDTAEVGEPPKEKEKRIRLSKFYRRKMIGAMVEMQTKASANRKRRTPMSFNPGGYVSEDEDGDDMMNEMRASDENWMVHLPQDMQDSLVAMEQGSVVVDLPAAVVVSQDQGSVAQDSKQVETVSRQNATATASSVSAASVSASSVSGPLMNSANPSPFLPTWDTQPENYSPALVTWSSSQPFEMTKLPFVGGPGTSMFSPSRILTLPSPGAASPNLLPSLLPRPATTLPSERRVVQVKQEIPAFSSSSVDSNDIASYVPASLSLSPMRPYRVASAYSKSEAPSPLQNVASYSPTPPAFVRCPAAVSVVPNADGFLPSVGNANPGSSVGLALPSSDSNTVVLLLGNGSHICDAESSGSVPLQLPLMTSVEGVAGYQPNRGAVSTQKRPASRGAVELELDNDGEPTVASLLAAKKRKQ